MINPAFIGGLTIFAVNSYSSMSSGLILKIHFVSVTVFLVFYLLKTFFLLSGKHAALDTFYKNILIFEIICAFLFLVTGVWLIAIAGDMKSQQMVKLVLVFASIPLAVVGFKRKIKVLAMSSFLMLTAAYVVAEASRSKPYPVRHAPQGEPVIGKYLFEHNCTQCHGADGKKAYRDAADLSLSIKDASATASVIRNGRHKKMPAFGGLLSETEIHAVTEYVISLRE